MQNGIIPQNVIDAGQSAYAQLISDMIAMEHGIELGLAGYADTAEDAAKLPVWMRTASTKAAHKVGASGAAVLPKSAQGDSDIPRLPNYLKILTALSKNVKCREKAFVRSLLRDICFQHHQSTNGRWDTDLQRFERWGARPVDDWRRSCVNKVAAPASDAVIVSERTFHRIKGELIDQGLIVAQPHLWHGKTVLWIKPTEKLCRIVFEAGYLETTSSTDQPKPVQPASTGTVAKKPRGLSARHAAIDVELKDLYRKATTTNCSHLTKADRWKIFERLTQPIVLSPKMEKPAFAAPGSYRFHRLHDDLGLMSE
ncbi:hypothetical protein [Rhizobium sp. PL01]|uniref:hypothetical protein n=1 Tax=Rhizobium sp. PL01 TaxID=3085631 RepID=UPI00298147DB|nr:hypothetical protein [Rhizobium sp. PL01]MDW5313777.1 hypothetical protein [Rhizobium sp. PL01]